MTHALETRGLSVRYGGVVALDGVDLTVSRGQMVGLIGPNGAGKTTCIDAISGFTPAQGEVLLGELPVTGLNPHRRARRGLARTWQAGAVFEDLTVRENLAVSASRTPLWKLGADLLRGRVTVPEVVESTIVDIGLEEVADASAAQLTEGQRKLLGVARALVSEPRVVCLDEPAAGLDTGESVRLGRELRRIVDRGVAVLLVDHDMGLVMSVCDVVVVLNFGVVIATGSPEEVRRNPQVVEAYLGSSANEALALIDE